MRTLLFLIPLSLLFPLAGQAEVAVQRECANEVTRALLRSGNEKAAKAFLTLQGKITIHKLAWSLIWKDHSVGKFKIEQAITEAIEKLNDQTNGEFVKARNLFNENRLSRRALAEILPHISNILRDQQQIGNDAAKKSFILTDSDAKLLAILGQQEKILRNGKLDARMTEDAGKASSVLNFAKIINSSLNERAADTALKKHLEKEITRLQAELSQTIKDLKLSESCMTLINSCRADDSPNGGVMGAIVDAIDAALQHANRLEYGDVWLRVPLGRPRQHSADPLQPSDPTGPPPEPPLIPTPPTLPTVEVHGPILPPAEEQNLSETNPTGDRPLPDTVIIEPVADRPPVLPPSEKALDPSLMRAALVERVLDRLPMLVTRKQLEENPRLLHALARAIDSDPQVFTYDGKQFVLPSVVNGPVRYAEKASPQYRAELTLYGKRDLSAIPANQRSAFLGRWVMLHKHSRQRRSFEFEGKIYDLETGAPLRLDTLKEGEGLLRYPYDPRQFPGKTVQQAHDAYGEFQRFPLERQAAIQAALLKGDRSYVFGGRAYTLSSLSIDPYQALQKVTRDESYVIDAMNRTPSSLADRDRLTSFLSGKSREEQAQITNALFNGERAIRSGGQVYDSATLKPVSAQEMNRAINTFRAQLGSSQVQLPEGDFELTAALYTAISNSQATFRVRGQEYHTATIGPVDGGPLHLTRQSWDYRERAQEIEVMNRMGDEALVRRYHQLFPNPKPECKYYTVVNKKDARLKVYSNDGQNLFEREVLLGAVRSDKRMREIARPGAPAEVAPDEHRPVPTNQVTGAGIYYSLDYREPSDHPRYEFYGGCSLAMMYETGASFKPVREPVLNQINRGLEIPQAIHQVPPSLKADRDGKAGRDGLFNNGNLDDNRTTDGCVNLLEKDCLDYKANYDVMGCPVYILPEEPQNRFVVENGTLRFVSKDSKGCRKNPDGTNPDNRCNEDYYYSNPDRVPNDSWKPIKLAPNDRTVVTPTTRQFLDTLETEKAALMKEFKLTNEEYNQLAMVAFGYLGVESSSGESSWFRLKEAPVFSHLIPLVRSAGGWKGSASRGLTQIKDVSKYLKGVTEEDRKRPATRYSHITEEMLNVPRNAAIATIAVLADMLTTMKASEKNHEAITPSNRYKFLYYVYNGSDDVRDGNATPEINAKIQKISAYMNRLSIYECPSTTPVCKAK